MAAKMAEVLRRLGHRRALVFAGHGGIDELGLDGPSACYEVTPAGVRPFTVDPAGLGLAAAPISALRGGDATENAARIRDVLGGHPGPARDVVLLNAAAALVAAERVATLGEGIPLAARSIDSGEATVRLEALIAASREVLA
jgi:anthranilate phosphoribosyltransferase